MKPERWARIEQIYHAALEREPAERASHLDEACGGDETLRRQVAALLASDDQAPGFIESPALQVAAQALAASNLTEARTKAEQSFSLQTGGQIGAYQLLGPIGRGGMGEVHLALDPRLGRKVAIKLLPPKFTADAERVRRFAQEARAASALNHPNIITIHEIGEVATEAGATKKQAATTGDAGTAQAPAKNQAAGVWRRLSVAVCVLALLVAGAGWIYKRNASMNKAKAALPRIEELAQAERFFEAYNRAIEAQKYLPNDPTLTRLMRTIADDLSVVTDPPGAQVYLKRFTPDGAGNSTVRQSIGMTPINHRQIARGAYVVSIEKEGYANIERTVTGLMLRIGGILAPSDQYRER